MCKVHKSVNKYKPVAKGKRYNAKNKVNKSVNNRSRLKPDLPSESNQKRTRKAL